MSGQTMQHGPTGLAAVSSSRVH